MVDLKEKERVRLAELNIRMLDEKKG